MADITFNIALGRAVELYSRVDGNDPANSAFIVVALKASGLESDATLKDYDTLAASLAAATDEATNTGYARKVLTDADLSALTVDDTNNWVDLDVADQTWTSVQTSGGAWGALLFCYDADTTGGSDTNIVPITKQDFAVTPDGTDITAQITGFQRVT